MILIQRRRFHDHGLHGEWSPLQDRGWCSASDTAMMTHGHGLSRLDAAWLVVHQVVRGGGYVLDEPCGSAGVILVITVMRVVDW